MCTRILAKTKSSAIWLAPTVWTTTAAKVSAFTHPDLIVKKVYPCESISQKRNHNAEMCPESAVKSHQQILAAGQEIVGWYHSHPNFNTDPSNIDIRNH